jgi:hypothetical protein
MESYKAWVIADDSGKWATNGLAFATREEAELYAKDLWRRWLLVREWKVEPSDEPVNYRFFEDGTYEQVES